MFISPSRRSAFLHIHKAGGSSVEVALSKQLLWNDLLLGSTDFGEQLSILYGGMFGLYKHSSARDVVQMLGRQLWDSYYTWATVRNPYKRIVSLYLYIKVLSDNLKKSPQFPAGSSDVLPWIDSDRYPRDGAWQYPAVKAGLACHGRKDAFSYFIRSPFLAMDNAFDSQFSRLSDEQGRLMLVETVDVDQLDGRWASICEKCGIRPIPLSRENVTPLASEMPEGVLNSSDDVDFLYARFKDDFEHFGYDARRPVF